MPPDITPIVRHFLLCEDARVDSKSNCTQIECLISVIVSRGTPPFPIKRDRLCAYLLLTDCYGEGIVQVQVAHEDVGGRVSLFGSAERRLDFRGITPAGLCRAMFRLDGCIFPKAGRYVMQFWYNGTVLAEYPFELR